MTYVHEFVCCVVNLGLEEGEMGSVIVGGVRLSADDILGIWEGGHADGSGD